MTQLDVVYRYGAPPTERTMLALAKVRDVYGVRRMEFDEAEKTVRVEYDASRLSGPVIHQLLRRAGLDIVETCLADLASPGDCACRAGEPFSGLGKGSERVRLSLRRSSSAVCARSSAG